MSRFYASIQGQRGAVTRTGASSIEGHIRGWDIGVKVEGKVMNNGEIAFYIYATGGNNGAGRLEPVAIIENGQIISCCPKGFKVIGDYHA